MLPKNSVRSQKTHYLCILTYNRFMKVGSWTMWGTRVTREVTCGCSCGLKSHAKMCLCAHFRRRGRQACVWICSVTIILNLSVKIIASVIVITEDQWIAFTPSCCRQTDTHRRTHTEGKREREMCCYLVQRDEVAMEGFGAGITW